MKIIITDAENSKKEYSFNQGEITVGRGKDCEVTISSSKISRAHLLILKKADDIFIKDISESNWVRLDEEKISKNENKQYYDFSTLTLPGEYSVEIEKDNATITDLDIANEDDEKTRGESDPSRNFNIDHSYVKKYTESKPEKVDETPKVERPRRPKALKLEKKVVNKTININSPDKDKPNASARQTPIELEKPKKRKIKKPKKGIILIPLLIIVGFFLFGEELFQDKEKIERERVKAENAKIGMNKISETRQKESKNKLNFEELIRSKEKCSSSSMSKLCALLLPQTSNFEGIIREDTVVNVFANFDKRLISFFRDNLHQLDPSKKKANIKELMAASILMKTKIMKRLEMANIQFMRIYFFTIESGKLSFEGSYVLDTSLYRRFSAKDLSITFKHVKKKLNFKEFDKKYFKFIKKD